MVLKNKEIAIFLKYGLIKLKNGYKKKSLIFSKKIKLL